MKILKQESYFIGLVLSLGALLLYVSSSSVEGWILPTIGGGLSGLVVGMKFRDRIWRLLYSLGIEEKNASKKSGDTREEETYEEIK